MRREISAGRERGEEAEKKSGSGKDCARKKLRIIIFVAKYTTSSGSTSILIKKERKDYLLCACVYVCGY